MDKDAQSQDGGVNRRTGRSYFLGLEPADGEIRVVAVWKLGRSNYFSNRMAADRPWASKPSTSANFFTAATDFLREAGLYSTTLVRR